MADKKKDEVPKHIDTYYKNVEKMEKLVNTMDHHHRSAYATAVDKVLMDEKTGLLDYAKLKDSKNQLKFADTMADYYFDKAVSYFGFKKENEKLTKSIKDDVFKKDMMMQAYANVTQSELRALAAEGKDKFSYDVFNKHKNEKLLKPVIARLGMAARSHLTDEHIDDIVRYTNAKDYIVRENLDLQHAINLLDVHKSDGALPKKGEALAELVGEYAVKPELRPNYKKPEKKAA